MLKHFFANLVAVAPVMALQSRLRLNSSCDGEFFIATLESCKKKNLCMATLVHL